MNVLPPLDGLALHYRGDLCGRIEGHVVGPNTMGERFVIVTTAYDEAADRTTVGLRFATVEDIEKAT